MTYKRPSYERPPGHDDDPIAARLSSLRWSTAIVLVGFLVNAGIVVLLISVISGSIIVALIAVVVMAAFILASALFIEAFLLNVTGARPLLPGDFPWLQSTVADLAAGFGIPEPEIYISPLDDLQAMTTGLGQKTKVVFCSALLREFSQDEVKAVAAHELAHAANRDVPLLVWTNAVSLWVAFISNLALIASHGLFGVGRGAANVRGGDWTWAVAGWIIAALAFVFGALLWVSTQVWSLISLLTRQAVSRQREYLADATAVAITGDAGTLSQALAKIAERPQLSKGATVSGSFCIVSPFSGQGWWDELTSTHPTPERRIEEIQKLSSATLRVARGDRNDVGSVGVVLPVGSIALLVLLALTIPLLLKSGDSGSQFVRSSQGPSAPSAPAVNAPVAGRTPSVTPSPRVLGASATPSPHVLGASATPFSPVVTAPGTTSPRPSASPTPSVSPTMTVPAPSTCPSTPAGTLIYEANWAEGAGGWPLLFGWKWLDGMLVNDASNGSGNNWIAAPYDLGACIRDYAVEAEIKFDRVIAQHPTYCGTFGILARGQYQAGVKAEAGGVDCIEGSGNRGLLLRLLGGEYLKFKVFDLDEGWHTYRLEVNGNIMSLFFDRALMLETTDNRFLEPGEAGMWSALSQVSVRSFKIIVLD